ncbi:MAG: plasmid stabilization protein [Gallionellales bacterium CG_4_10_14_3_um_filter_54_96]|nr:MAG: plasmid stabilization protein [Gallionellales bacterium CG03_land_8_20_14_0_80_55_15]PIV91613.1 MAG: plasmid stabilization protein [Gallionellales bacterium CG17_big_fil_post_rev_8_21_14_2_50_54_146]PIX04326.1 MAG: plasmid stabilization protein [Gallionellales bacterium CG_4_8_14_3_um_filter_54_18]PIY05041.1 MAG: plasmid stabilization protein [Gallionellales bacterium CG_4_10_14_3_um_filter_54_96]PJC05571.1 MAG: plasmid stabilization protein [Gallionellales bacterium CG_4_9_14_0_8_um_fi
MNYEVLLTRSAERDLEGIHDYICDHDSPQNADYVLDSLLEVVATLSTFPERGSYPKELAALGIREYRQAHFKPYRILYRVIAKQVFIYLIADGRRNMQTLLSRRMLDF